MKRCRMFCHKWRNLYNGSAVGIKRENPLIIFGYPVTSYEKIFLSLYPAYLLDQKKLGKICLKCYKIYVKNSPILTIYSEEMLKKEIAHPDKLFTVEEDSDGYFIVKEIRK